MISSRVYQIHLPGASVLDASESCTAAYHSAARSPTPWLALSQCKYPYQRVLRIYEYMHKSTRRSTATVAVEGTFGGVY